MKLKEASLENGGAELRLVFGHETGDITKRIRLDRRWGPLTPHVVYGVEKFTVEAERDIAFRMFGGEWRAHVTTAHTPEREKMVVSVLRQLQAAIPLESLEEQAA